MKIPLSSGLFILCGVFTALPVSGIEANPDAGKTTLVQATKAQTTQWIGKYNVLVKALDAEIIRGYLAKPRTVSQAEFLKWRSNIAKASADLQTLPVPSDFMRLNQLINQIVKDDHYLCYHLAVVPKVDLNRLKGQPRVEYRASLKRLREINFKKDSAKSILRCW